MRMDDLARKAGITRQTLSSIENGLDNYSFSSLLKVLNVLEISLMIDDNNVKPSRQRASRINKKLDKTINRFIVMCVEQYAESIKQPSYTVYPKMKQKGVIDYLKSDYEDMHGMSTEYINDFIHGLLEK
ncbi:MAG: DUF3791 domain-containing protein [Bacilli bacterium]|nr:DUF3791 domain-containing protein [Bacilli bacterium]